MGNDGDAFRWNDYVLTRGSDVEALWRSHLASRRRDVLFILGQGFDPRMCAGVEAILSFGGTGKRDCVLVRYDEGAESASKEHSEDVKVNARRLENAIVKSGRGKIHPIDTRMWSEEGRRIGPVEVAKAFGAKNPFAAYSDLVVDISALPRGMYFPMLNRLLGQCLDGGLRQTNLHVLVAEDVALDAKIVEVGIDDAADYVPGFAAQIGMESTKGIPRLWVPVLGEHQEAQLRKIRALVTPDEVCPLVPFPSQDPRRGDSLLLTHEYCRLFFDDMRIDPSNILYADERNPFQVYRQIRDVAKRYERAFMSLGGCGAVLSALSSKLLSLGVLLAAVQLKKSGHVVGIAHVDTRGYRIEGITEDAAAANHELFHVWLSGECYEA